MVSEGPRQLNLLQQGFLEGLQAKFGRPDDAGRLPLLDPVQEGDEVVVFEVPTLPVSIEDGGHLLDNATVPDAGNADIPFQAGLLRLVGQV